MIMDQGIYKKRVQNDRNFFEIPAILSCEQGNPQQKSSKKKIYVCSLNFLALFYAEFPHSQDKRVEISKKKSVFLYPIFIHSIL